MKVFKFIYVFTLIFISLTINLKAHVPLSYGKPEKVPSMTLQAAKILKSVQLGLDTVITDLLEQINEDSIRNNIKCLKDFGTRLCTSPEALLAQNWIESKLLGYGYPVNIQNLSLPVGSSGNVVASLTGCTYPDEFIVIGAHYDSYSGEILAPGADDNASGTAAVIEIARVLSSHSFNRSIVFGLWAAEEYGLYGSTAYAQQAAAGNMNILGYLNLDMCGYQAGSEISTDVAGPASAQPLLDLYQDVCSIYLPDFIVNFSNNLPGSSDFASFNSAGYMGIFPFEDELNYSPYIHTIADTLGLSVNSLPMAATYARSVMATALEMAIIDNTGVGVDNSPYFVNSLTCSPNPFTDGTKISFKLSSASHIRLDIYNSIGQHIICPGDDDLASGDHSYYFKGEKLESGIYYFRLISKENILTGKLVKGN